MLTRSELLLIAGIVLVCLAIIVFVSSSFAKKEQNYKSKSKPRRAKS